MNLKLHNTFENYKTQVPVSIIDATGTAVDEQSLLTTLYLFLQMHRTLNGKVIVMPVLLFRGCGYTYGTNTNNKTRLHYLLNLLNYLREQGYIEYFENLTTSEQFAVFDEDVEIKPNTLLSISLTDKCLQSDERFILISVAEYSQLGDIAMDTRFPFYRNACNLYCYLLRHMYVVLRDKKAPLVYYSKGTQALADEVPGISSRTTINGLLNALEQKGLIHTDTTKGWRLNEGGIIQGYKVIVRDQPGWEYQLRDAMAESRKAQKDYYIKQGLLTE